MVYAQIIAENIAELTDMQITLQARRWPVEPNNPWCENGVQASVVWDARNFVEPTKAGSEKR